MPTNLDVVVPSYMNMTLEEVLNDYLANQFLSDLTKKSYAYQVHRFCPHLLPLAMTGITPEIIGGLEHSLRRPGGAHDRKRLTVLDTLLKYAARKDSLNTNSHRQADMQDMSFVTLGMVYFEYLQTGRLKPQTQQNYSQRLTCYLSDWVDLPVNSITKQMVEDRHHEISISSPSAANSVFRTLRALLNYAAMKYEDADGQPLIKANPTRRLSELRQWNKDHRRESVIQIKQIGLFFRTVWTLENKTARDVLLTLLCTGLRLNEVLTLKWEQIDLGLGLLTIPREKSKNGNPLTIPLSDFVWRLIAERKFGAENAYVFPGRCGSRVESSLSTVQNSVDIVKAKSGISFMCHDLRRTFVSVADELELDQNVIKNLINHHNGDITESYTVRSMERLRRVTQRVTTFILEQASIEFGPARRDEQREKAMRRILALPILNMEER